MVNYKLESDDKSYSVSGFDSLKSARRTAYNYVIRNDGGVYVYVQHEPYHKYEAKGVVFLSGTVCWADFGSESESPRVLKSDGTLGIDSAYTRAKGKNLHQQRKYVQRGEVMREQKRMTRFGRY